MNQSGKGIKQAKRNKKKKMMKRMILLFVLTFTICVVGALIYVGWQKIGIPCLEMYANAVEFVSDSTEDTFKASQTSLVYDKNGDLLLSLKGEKDVYYLEYDEIPDAAKLAMISIEDKKFVYHRGADIKAIARAAVALVKNRGEVTQGGSTITQQLSRNVFLSHQVSWKRKVEEIFISLELEKKYSKEDIMEFYLNNIYFSNGYYGIQAASKGYFRKDVDELSLSQIAFLCAIPNSPTYYDPLEYPEHTLERRDKILKNMYEDGYINEEQYNQALEEEITVKKKKKRSIHDYVETYILKCATESLMKANGFEFQNTFETTAEEEEYNENYNEQYEKWQQSLYTSGYRIYTSIDLDMQETLQESVNSNLSEFTSEDDEGNYLVQGSAVCIDNETGRVVAIVGGRQKNDSQTYTLNRAFQTYRQPGSAIKPLLVYTPIMERGMNPYSTVDDSRLSDNAVSNSGGNYSGKITLRRAVQKSSNVATYRLYEELTPSVALSYLEKMNFKGLEPEDYEYMTTCLGGFTRGTNTLEMAAAYATLANDGLYRDPTCIVKITNADGWTIVDDEVEEERVYQEDAARKMTDVLQSVVDSYPGTARGCKLDDQPAAAKTGTTTSNTDGWLCGYTPYYTTCVWVGQDTVKTVDGLTGSSYPAYIWTDFMKQIHESLPKLEFATYTGQKTADSYYTSKTTASQTTTTATTEATETETPTTEATETPTTETPSTEAPATEAPNTEAPATEAVDPPEE
jgi:1A family penicillin-binding protein